MVLFVLGRFFSDLLPQRGASLCPSKELIFVELELLLGRRWVILTEFPRIKVNMVAEGIQVAHLLDLIHGLQDIGHHLVLLELCLVIGLE